MTSVSSKRGLSLARAEASGTLRARTPSELQAETSFGSPETLSNSGSYASEQLAREEVERRTAFETIDSDVTMSVGGRMQPLLFTSDSLPSHRRAKAKSHLSLLRTDSRHGHLSSYQADNEESPLIDREQLQLEDAAPQDDPTKGAEDADELERAAGGEATSFGTFPSSSSTRKKTSWWSRRSKRPNVKILKKVFHHCKVVALTCILVASIIMFAIYPDDKSGGTVLAVTDGKNETLSFGVSDGHWETKLVTVTLTGPFDDSAEVKFCKDNNSCSEYPKSVIVCGSRSGSETKCTGNSAKSCCLAVPLVNACCKNVSDYQDSIATVTLNYEFEPRVETIFEFLTQFPDIVPFTVQIEGSNLDTPIQVAIAAIILAGVYVLIIFEVRDDYARLSQVLNLDPRYVLIAEVLFSNIGGTATAIGDPPNVIIVSSPHIKEEDIYFNEFTLHVFLGILFVFVLSLLVLRLLFCVCRVRLHNPEPQEVVEMKRELAIWQRTAARLPVVSLEERAVREALQAKAHEVEQQLKENFSLFVLPTSELWRSRLPELEAKYTITDKNLLLRSSAVLLVVIVLFFVSNLIEALHLDLGWIAIFGAITLLVLADVQDIEAVLEKVEWGTLVFFAGLFVLMELLAELGLINFIASVVVSIIEQVPPGVQMTVAMLLILWVSALASAFIDNIPFTAAIIPVIVDVANNNPCVSLRPLVWALALGACLGGNGTLIGASANVVCAGIAEQNGYRISFRMFFKIGFPMMLLTAFIAMLYLLICHTWIGWNIDNTSCPNGTNGTYS